MTVQRVIDQIEAAFSGVRLGDEPSLHQAQLADQGLGRVISEKEFQLARQRDGHLSWLEVPERDLENCDASLSHLTPEGWHFYIPAYMRRAAKLIGRPIIDSCFAGSVVFHLTLPEEGNSLRPYVLERFSLLSGPQVQAVRLFLVLASSSDAAEYLRQDAAVALRRFWALSDEERPNSSLKRTNQSLRD